ncbi:hypothetical protein P3X46_028036 [Hevea brasiliensis]|uniref:Late embryogenesis abundant protein LEA-2 subgroup domain-containing protein n=1 Tax=Hevea brasiliensis TaxID=3981 RepID=A0ABQ9KMR4_HEVBR|nr:NDR1/HIN1-like protein 6 [Hevea brasiliensis]KAJ9145681.1 hypothetical protein P3X46_028036 [Hevea brasiliensis]
MTDGQKIHPTGDVEALPTSPLVPPGSAISDKATTHPPSRPLPPPQLRTNFPAAIHSATEAPKTRRSCCCKCICWTIGIIFLALIVISAIIGILYLIFQPKIPKYSVDSLKISDLRLTFDMSLYAEFDVKITANNPNKKIGIYYEKGGSLRVWYGDSELCAGSIPKFYQGHRNVTKLDVSLSGQTQYGRSLMSALQEQQQTGRIPLDLKVEAPVSVKLGRLKLRKVRIFGDCILLVDSLSTDNFISIKARNCKFRLKL